MAVIVLSLYGTFITKSIFVELNMKKIENLLLRAAGYTVLILLMFYIFGLASDFTDAYINFQTFMLIFGFGVLISLAGLIFSVKKLILALRVLIHYVVLLVAFCVIFISTGNISSAGGGAIFTAVIIFTVLYGVIFGVSYGILLAVRKTDEKIDRKFKAEIKKEVKKDKYLPLYKTEE